jgi:phenylpropionate dioxygenase-like ring-hydroxylating dioxygenase large terminal subunit
VSPHKPPGPAADPLELAWHPACLGTELGSGPLGLRLLGRDLVAFRDAGGVARVVGGRCPHRGTSLALGTVAEGCVVCPYHGWRFDGIGACTRIPSQDAGLPVPPAARLPGLASREVGGIVWASRDPGAGPRAVPVLPEASDTDMRVIPGEPFTWRTSAGRHLENILDLGHFPFVHPGTFGSPDAEVVEPHEVERAPGRIRAEVGVTTVNPETPGGRLYPGLGPLIRLGYTYTVDLPFRITLEFAFPDGMRRALHEVVAPVAPDECRVYWCLLADPRLRSSDEEELDFAARVFAEDRPVIESQPPGVPLDRRAEVHVAADKLAVAWRAALREAGMPEGAFV